jgi:phosphatidylglycerophosphate synthase
MVLFKHRSKFEEFSLKVGKKFAKLKLTPNQWTGLSLVFVIITFYLLVLGVFFWASLFFFLAIVMDFIDGSVARATRKVSKFGAYLDTIIDRYVEAVVLFGLLFVSLPYLVLPAYAWIFLMLFGGFMTSYAKAAAMEKGLTKKEIKGGVMERAERVFILFIGLILASASLLYLVIILAILAIFTNITALQRIWIAKK